MERAEFEIISDELLERLTEDIEDRFTEFEIDLHQGILTIDKPDGAQIVINKHGPTRQIWLASSKTGSALHFAYDERVEKWLCTRTGAELVEFTMSELG